MLPVVFAASVPTWLAVAVVRLKEPAPCRVSVLALIEPAAAGDPAAAALAAVRFRAKPAVEALLTAPPNEMLPAAPAVVTLSVWLMAVGSSVLVKATAPLVLVVSVVGDDPSFTAL